jgi:LysR family transcriptional regulator, cys regulon transcriptional activator
MNLQQFRFLREAARHKFSITLAARALHTSQPGVSKAIIELEGELGVPILARQGKRILGVTPPGQQVLDAAERIMKEVDDLKKMARDYAGAPYGTLRVATTHTQARYVLPPVVQQFARKFPQVRLKLLQGDPPHIAAMLVNGQADLGLATESLAEAAALASIPIYEWQHVALVPPGHPLARLQKTPGKLSLKDLARHPIVTYEAHFSGRSRIDAAFAAAALEPSIVLEAIDADVIKTYVATGMGVGIVAGVAADPRAEALTCCPAATCSAPTPRGWRSSAAPTCADSSTRSSNCSRRAGTGAGSSRHLPRRARRPPEAAGLDWQRFATRSIGSLDELAHRRAAGSRAERRARPGGQPTA